MRCHRRTSRGTRRRRAAASPARSVEPPGGRAPGGRACRDRTVRVTQAVERLVGQPVGVRVALAGDPGERRAGRRQPAGLQRQRLHVGVLDLPGARHLLDHQPGVHPHLERGVGRVLAVELQPGDQTAVLRDVVGGDADRLAPLGDGLAGGGVLEHGAVRRRAGVAARATVGLDPDRGRGRSIGVPAESGAQRAILWGVHNPESAVRTRIRWHSSQRITSSDGAAAIARRSAAFMESRQPPHSPRVRAAAPTPFFCSRSRW